MVASGRLPVERVAGGDDGRYAALLADRPEATFFHSRQWAAIVRAGFPALRDGSGVYRIGEKLYAVPLFHWKRLGGLLTTTHSSFPFLYGGPIPADPEASAALLAHLYSRPGSLVVEGNPFAGPWSADAAAVQAEAQPAPYSVPPPAEEVTHLLRLPASPEAYWDGVLTTQKRNDIRRAMKKGVTIDLSNDPADVDLAYALYQQRMQTWTQRPGLIYPLSFYAALMSHGGDAVRLYLARAEGQVIGATFVCRWNGIVHYNAGYFDHEHRNLRPNIVIQERIIRDAITDGFRLYDMLPSAGLRNVEEFKESFGAVRTVFPRYTKIGRLHRLAAGLRGARRAADKMEQS